MNKLMILELSLSHSVFLGRFLFGFDLKISRLQNFLLHRNIILHDLAYFSMSDAKWRGACRRKPNEIKFLNFKLAAAFALSIQNLDFYITHSAMGAAGYSNVLTNVHSEANVLNRHLFTIRIFAANEWSRAIG